MTSSRAASHVSAGPLIGCHFAVLNSRVRRSSEEAPATCVMPSRRSEPFDPKTWKLKPGPVAVIVPRYPDAPFFIRNSIDVVSSLSTCTTRRTL